jgi:NAD(P)H-flavin reductase
MVGFLANWHGPTVGNRVLVCGNLQMMMISMQQLGSRGKSMNVCSGFWLEIMNSCVRNCLEKLHLVRRQGYELLHALYFGENDILFWGHGSMIS